jgi:hypothetical protein
VRHLGFRCSYSALKDVDGASACGRRATQRAQGDPKCLGHWAVAYLFLVIGRTEQARSTWTAVYAIALCLGVAALANEVGHWWPTESSPLYVNVVTTAMLAGMFVSLQGERAFGGVVWLVFMPFSGVAGLIYGGTLLTEKLSSIGDGAGPVEGAAGAVGIAANVLIGFLLLGMWANFVLFYFGRYRWMDRVALLGNGAYILLIVAAVVLAIVSGGSKNSLLMMVIIGLGAIAVTKGAARFRKLAQRLRV